MTSMKAKGRRSNADLEETAVPDSTTKEAEFCPGQDVLLKQKDGRYYLGTVVEVDGIREQCLVKFGDNTDSWSSFKDLTKLSTPQQEDLLCVVCKKSAPKNKKEITVCDKCGRGYHQKCHHPEIPPECQKEDLIWMCRRCLTSEPHRLKKSDSKHLKREPPRNTASSSSDSSFTAPITKVLPYDLNSLSWDTYHRVNSEHTYCYCGENGEWYKQMLQCGRCKQWYHERCLDCLQFPLYCGDRFYVFVCSVCNHGKEFLRRLEMKWVDLVHLMLFNLTAYNSKKYYDLDTIVIPYINDNWHALQLPPKIASVSKTERRDNILSILTNNRNRFKCGREIKKRTTIWGLRVRLPPPAPTVTLNFTGRVSDEELREMWQGNRRLQFLSASSGIVPCDNHMRGLMMGLAYQQSSNPSETDSPCPSPEVEEPPHILTGCVKKSVPFSNISVQRRKRLLSASGRDRERGRPKRRNTNDGVCRNEAEGGYLTRLSLDNKNYKNSESLPLTPPTSVSAPPTPPASGSNSLLSDDFSEHTGVKKAKENGGENTPCDTSGDETSSKSTLDLIIPPPKDFEGKNNPFLALLRGGGEERTKRKSKDSITLPLPLTAVIPGKPLMRPTKRQLSEKDIFIGPNGEVKRRRLRRNNRCHQVYVAGQTASKTAAVVPVKTDAKEWGQRGMQPGTSQLNGCVDYALNGRRLRQRPEKPSDKEKQPPPPPSKPSPVKQEPDINMDDLKSSVNIYFGAANRIAAGERFAVKAKRIGPSGKLEFLIEWEGAGNGMT
uniref:Metal response element binding transcription factor 2 n=1 Tax=Gnatocerus cornutus TaxID=1553328 RepID=A0A1L7N288_9CUCU|nr:metal response element binding transcription factor 2 [Gnatocerus cornutus]